MSQADKKLSIAIVLIATWKYSKFIDGTVKGIRKFFFPKSNVEIFLHTDSDECYDADYIKKIDHEPWPLITLKRYHLIVDNADIYSKYDQVFYLDIDVIIKNYVNEDILSNKLTVVRHYLFTDSDGTPERNPESLAYIPEGESHTYVAGGFWGGPSAVIIEFCKQMKNNIEKDLKKGIIAIWHDESHLNAYTHYNQKLISYLHPKYISLRRDAFHGTPAFDYDPIIIPLLDDEVDIPGPSKGFRKTDDHISEIPKTLKS